MAATYRCEPLGNIEKTARAAFSCGHEELDRYFHQYAGQDQKRGIAKTYVFVQIPTGRIAGYYNIAATSVEVSALPPDIARKMPRYPTVPALLIGRLARDLRFRSAGVGELLLSNALKRCNRLAEELGAIGIVVDAIDPPARAFYERYQFSCFPDQKDKLILPMGTVAAVVASIGA